MPIFYLHFFFQYDRKYVKHVETTDTPQSGICLINVTYIAYIHSLLTTARQYAKPFQSTMSYDSTTGIKLHK